MVESEEYEYINKEISTKYRFTKLARVIALLLQFEKSKTDETYKATHKQMHDYYDSLKHAHAKFCVVFFLCCYIIDRLDKVIYFILQLLHNASEDKFIFLNQINFLNTVFRDSEMWQAFLNAFYALRLADESSNIYPKTSDLFLLELKLTIEDIHEHKSRFFNQYEVSRLERFNSIDEVVLEAYCSSCKLFTIAIMKTMDFLDMSIQLHVSKRYVSNIKCKCDRGYLDFDVII